MIDKHGYRPLGSHRNSLYHWAERPDLAEHRLPLAWTTSRSTAPSQVLALNLILNGGPRGGRIIIIPDPAIWGLTSKNASSY